jgi:D-galactarolactone cycloisomerase
MLARESWQLLWQASESAYAVSALSLALDDRRGRRLGIPIAALYGGRVRDRVEAYASSGGYYAGRPPAETWPVEVEELVHRGFRGIKLRVGRYPAADELPVLEHLRAGLPQELKLMADGNAAAYTFGQAVRMGQGLGSLGFRWFDEPMPQQDGYVGYDRLNAALDIALAGGEITETRGQASELIDRAAVDIIQPNVSICGGVGELLFMADLAQLEAIRCVPHVWLGVVSMAATLQALAVLPDPTRSPATEVPMLEYDVAENPFRADLVSTPITMEDGMIRVPDGPGSASRWMRFTCGVRPRRRAR